MSFILFALLLVALGLTFDLLLALHRCGMVGTWRRRHHDHPIPPSPRSAHAAMRGARG